MGTQDIHILILFIDLAYAPFENSVFK